MEHFDAEEFLALIERYRVTHTRSCRRCSSACSSCPTRCAARYDVSSLQCVVHAAAPCPVPVKQQMIEWFGPVIHEYYAGTEGNGFVYCNSEQWLAHPGTVGRADRLPSTSSTTTARSCPPGEAARSTSRAGPQFEYHNDPEKTKPPRHPKAGARSATSATSTTTASSTSPTARRT